LRSEGFIHLSRQEQIHLPANALYSETAGLLLLWIDPSRLACEIREEPPAPGSTITFPHLYGPLNVDAVIAESPLTP
jgi:glutathione S-transferase